MRIHFQKIIQFVVTSLCFICDLLLLIIYYSFVYCEYICTEILFREGLP